MRLKKGALICLVGIDGSGKSTQVRMLLDALNQEGNRFIGVWNRWDPFLIKPIQVLLKKTIFKRKAVTNYNLPHGSNQKYAVWRDTKRRLFKNRMLAKIWQSLVFLDYAFQVFFKVKIPLIIGKNIISDRYVYDTIVDQVINFDFEEDSLQRLSNSLLIKLFPTPHISLLLDLPEEEAFKRKDDVPSLEYLIDRRQKYLRLGSSFNMIKVDAGEKKERIHKRIKKEIEDKLKINFNPVH